MKNRKSKAAAKPSSERAARGGAGDPSGIDMAAIERLIRLMTDHALVEVEVVSGPDRKIRLSRRTGEPGPFLMQAPSAAAAAPAAAAPSAAAGGAKAKPSDVLEFVSPMVGTFYRAPSPEAPPYVSTGDKVQPGSVLCIIEAMKVMNEIKAELGGEIVDILVENGEAVEFGQPLFHLKKSG